VAALLVAGAPLHGCADPDGQRALRLTRNEVAEEALGGRTWFGALTNFAGQPCTDVSIEIRFHDRAGRPAGTPVTARAVRLGPGAGLHLQARLPANATGLRIHALRWTRGGEMTRLGPRPPLPFGALRDRAPHAAGLLPGPGTG
jgi:hypothetical protein